MKKANHTKLTALLLAIVLLCASSRPALRKRTALILARYPRAAANRVRLKEVRKSPRLPRYATSLSAIRAVISMALYYVYLAWQIMS